MEKLHHRDKKLQRDNTRVIDPSVLAAKELPATLHRYPNPSTDLRQEASYTAESREISEKECDLGRNHPRPKVNWLLEKADFGWVQEEVSVGA